MHQLDVYDNIRVFHGGQSMRLVTNNPGTEIHSSFDEVAFWHPATQFNKIVCESVSTISDSRAKEEIIPLEGGLNTVLKLKGYSYYLKADQIKEGDRRLQYGFIAQEVEELIPSIVVESKGYKLLNYSEFIPFLVEALKEQQNRIDSLANQLQKSNQLTNSYKKENFETILNTSSLFQNSPNPFTSTTTIKFVISEK